MHHINLNIEQVKMILPHRDPFLFVDTVESLFVPDCQKELGDYELKDLLGAEVKAKYRTKKDHGIFQGHFPDYPIFPGVCQVEMMAQATSFVVCLLHKNPFGKKMDVALLGVDSARFRKPIFPEMDLNIHTKLLKVRGVFITSECQIFHQDQLMSEVTVMASLKFE